MYLSLYIYIYIYIYIMYVCMYVYDILCVVFPTTDWARHYSGGLNEEMASEREINLADRRVCKYFYAHRGGR
jgi:hypothetical protein